MSPKRPRLEQPELGQHEVYVKGVPAGGRALPELSLRESSDGEYFDVVRLGLGLGSGSGRGFLTLARSLSR